MYEKLGRIVTPYTSYILCRLIFDSIKMFTFYFIIIKYTELFRYYNVCIKILTLKAII